MAADLPDLQNHPSQQFGGGVRRAHGDPQRQHVHRHGRGPQGRRAPPVGQRQAQYHVVGAGDPVQMTGGRGHHQLGPGRLRGPCRRGQPVERRGGKVGDQVERSALRRVPGGGGAVRHGDGRARHARGPERPVGRVLLAGEIRRLLPGQLAQRGEPALGQRLPGGQRPVQLGDALPDEGQRVGVDGYVVHALVPEVALLADPEQGLRHQRPVGGEVHRAGQVLAHPRLGLRLGRLQPVHHGFGGDDPLYGNTVPLGHPHGERLRLGHRPPQRRREQVRVERPVDLDEVRRVEHCGSRGELVRVVDARLGAEQGDIRGGRALGVRRRGAGRVVQTLMHVGDDSPEGQRTPGC